MLTTREPCSGRNKSNKHPNIEFISGGGGIETFALEMTLFMKRFLSIAYPSTEPNVLITMQSAIHFNISFKYEIT